MKVYLDNCVLVDVEKGKYSLSNFCQIPDTSYYFSSAHINELYRGLERNPQLVDIRLSTIASLCGTNYIIPDAPSFQLEEEMKTPKDVFEQCRRNRFFAKLVEYSAQKFHVNRDGILAELSMDKIEVGNIEPSAILKILDEKFRESHYRCGLNDILNMAEVENGNTIFSTLFNLLDSICYWKDEKNINRLYDSSHANYAQYCDVLITNDRRMAIKAQSVYAYYGVHTKVMRTEEYFEEFANRKDSV